MILRSILSSRLRRAMMSAMSSDKRCISAGISDGDGTGPSVGFSSKIRRNANILSPGSVERMYFNASIRPAWITIRSEPITSIISEYSAEISRSRSVMRRGKSGRLVVRRLPNIFENLSISPIIAPPVNSLSTIVDKIASACAV